MSEYGPELIDVSWIPKMKARVVALEAENAELRKSALNQAGDNLCWLKGDEIKIPPRAEFLESCARYHAQISGERGELQGCRTIAQLEAEVERLEGTLRRITALRHNPVDLAAAAEAVSIAKEALGEQPK